MMVYKAVAKHGKPPFGGPVTHLGWRLHCDEWRGVLPHGLPVASGAVENYARPRGGNDKKFIASGREKSFERFC